MQNYVLAMFIEIKYFIIKITVHSFITDTEHRKLRRIMLQTSAKRFFSKHAWRQVSNYIHQSDEQFIAANVLEKKYAALIDAYNLTYTPHSIRYLKLLKENVPGLNDSKLQGVNYVSIRVKTGKDAEELLNPCTLYDMMERVSNAIWIKLKNVKNEFNGSFKEDHLCLVSCLFYSTYS